MTTAFETAARRGNLTAVEPEEELLVPAEESVVAPSRPMGINIGAHTVTKATDHLPEEQRLLVRWLHHHARAHHLEWKELATEVGISTSTLSRIFTDQYRYPKENVERDNAGNIVARRPHPKAGERIKLDGPCEMIKAFKRKAEGSGRAKNPEFVLTSTAERIFWLCERCLRNHRMGFLYGDAQVGKTTGLLQFAAEHNGGQTTYWDFPPASGVQYMLKCFAKALLVPTNQGFDKLLEDIIAALDPSKLVLIDNVHRVFDCYQKHSIVRCLNTLQYIYDKTGCGMVISATNTFRTNVKEGEFKKQLAQLTRRGRSYELQLATEPPRGDLDAIANWFGLDPAAGEAEQIMLHVAKQDGIGVFRLRLLDARDYAAKKKTPLNWEHFVKAYAITERASRVPSKQEGEKE